MTGQRKLSDQEEKPAKKVRIVIQKDRCKGCRYCVEICPKGILIIGNEMNAKGYALPNVAEENGCTGCGLCEMICPDFAIWLA